MDDLGNTDNAWMETVTMNFHDETGEILGNFEFEVCSLYKFFPERKLRTVEPAFTSLTRPDQIFVARSWPDLGRPLQLEGRTVLLRLTGIDHGFLIRSVFNAYPKKN